MLTVGGKQDCFHFTHFTSRQIECQVKLGWRSETVQTVLGFWE